MSRALQAGPWLRLARTQWAPLAALAVLALVSAVLAVTVPAATAAGYDRGASAAVGADADLRVTGKSHGTDAAVAVPDEVVLESNGLSWQQLLPGSLREVTGPPEASVAATGQMFMEGDFERPRLMGFDWDPGAWKRVRLVAGRPPVNKPPASDVPAAGQEVEVLVAQQYAQAMGYRPGDRATLRDPDARGPLYVRISGLFAPTDPRDPYWASRPGLLKAMRKIISPDGAEGDVGTALMDARGYTVLTHGADRTFTFTWRFPFRAAAFDNARAHAVRGDLDAYRTAVQGQAGPFSCTAVTALDGRLHGFDVRLRTARSILGTALAGLAAVAAGVLLLATGLLGERIRPVLGTMRARGASLRTLTGYACGLSALAVVPAAALGYAAGRLLDAGPPQSRSIVVVAGLVAVVLAVSAAPALRERGGGLGSARGGDLTAARSSPRRLVLDVLLVAVAVAGVVVLRRRGGASGADPLVAAVPVLLGAALGMLVLRAYPHLLRAAAPALRRGRGAVLFVGLARASRQTMIGSLPLVVLLLAAAVAGFSATVDTTLRDGQVRASYSTIGGDARLESAALDPGAVAKARAVHGVTAAVPARVVEGATGPGDQTPITVVGVDLAAYRAAFPHVPGVPGAPNGQLVSPEADRILKTGSRTVTLTSSLAGPIRVEPTGTIKEFPSVAPGSAFVIVPYKALDSMQRPSEIFIGGDRVDGAALGRVLAASSPKETTSSLQLRSEVLHDMTDVPTIDLVHRTFRDAALIAGGYGLLAVLFVLVVGARARARTVAHLRVLGLDRRRSRVLALVEIAPVLLCAVAAGWVLGLFLPEITGPVVDLRPYTSGYAATGHTPGAAALLALLAALLLAAAAALAVDRAFDRSALGDVLRTGD
ncbi:FtsX-like permease family protein [Actinomadura opuntiae]|uniref:FtsX-like permease family protein n=1 Tax=Actinomadura sp. OS1-43 TaxID=604315 RepID=UPI00255ACAFE|nr:FtsX-like permease family protein [Actinomadura sp. OS1-43]MDL4815391.1 hypothetical protein [Actinomadura sp. OS1-43]